MSIKDAARVARTHGGSAVVLTLDDDGTKPDPGRGWSASIGSLARVPWWARMVRWLRGWRRE